MIVSFADRGTEDVFNGRNTAAARRACPRRLWTVAARKLDQLDSAAALVDSAGSPGKPPGSPFRGPRGTASIRINGQYRICFVWADSGAERVEIVDYH